MSSAQFFNYPGTETNAEQYHYSQAVKLGNVVRTSGQGGWDEKGNITSDLEKQISVAFDNVLKALKAVDSRLSFNDIYAIRSYHIDMDKSFDAMTVQFKKLFPNHRPIWTCIQIGKLGLEGMQVEIEVEASLPA
ncbi:endoribonuclease L-PSP [Colletotrichum tofieldiae]|uniref:Endoribonuclease L-PSP n=2 Tax=Colletotrichum spaethianum species complex TaxID=2707349 RepID=A0A166MGV7_9PEZI|nr:endoribonuclease L-PSP [Colletotrichum tofieldiae]GJC83311.1 rutC family protein YjgH [Colletotrichum liriopes]GKT63025.1 endoribonuclease L-PSP [Colletotrichum tofieldiae]GKT72960.1 endoribonuclease L-PSP [Colletotrichum tofieldiae]GKT89191.1 endoribonuclease L-PSP [Colletotrichum tofieldiae]